MTIEFAILGLLSWRSFSGYDLKKIISESDLFYWSGNNNQIYRALVQLHTDDLVSQEVIYQESLPAKKVYSITEKGRVRLREWIMASPELPEIHNPFLIQLAWADPLSGQEIGGILDRYEEELAAQLVMLQGKNRRASEKPDRSPRENYLWQMINENILSKCQNELDWVRVVKKQLQMKGFFNENETGNKP